MIIFIVTLGYIIGIVWGLCTKSTIVPFLLLTILILSILKIFLNKNTKRYLKLIIKKQFIILFIISAIFSNTVLLLKENFINNKIYKLNNAEIIAIAVIKSQVEETKYKDVYTAQIEKIVDTNGEAQKVENLKFDVILRIKKSEQKLKYGDKIKLEGKCEIPSTATNDGVFDYKEYLKTKNIYLIVESQISQIELIKENSINVIQTILYNLRINIKDNIYTILDASKYRISNSDIVNNIDNTNNLNNENNVDSTNSLKNGNTSQKTSGATNASVLVGLLIGDTGDISEEIKDEFSSSNLSHMLAVSGAHTGYVVMGITFLLRKLKTSKKISKIITIVLLIFFMLLTGATPSVTRASIMLIYTIIATILYQKPSTIVSLSISSLLILIMRPYNILNVGFQLSYLGTIGIVTILNVLKNKNKVKNKILQMGIITLSANLLIIPVMLLNFNYMSLTFLISNIVTNQLFAITILLGFLILIVSFICMPIAKIAGILLNLIITILLKIIHICANIPFSKILLPTPNILQIVIYYSILIIILIAKNNIQRRWHRKLEKRYKKIIFVLIIVFFVSSLKLPHGLQIFFIDVGQGDSCLIVTPNNKSILIDGGGSDSSDYDVGTQVLLPFLLNKNITKLDYVLISHCDSDHIKGILSIMQQIEVKNAIISEQGKDSANYLEFMKITEEKNINVIVVKAGDSISISNVKIEILWPEEKQISENILNNNSIVAKVLYQNFSIIFMGDIEKIAEEKIVEKYKNTDKLKSDILKVAHHGSKTSSIEEILDLVNPKLALIGVGRKNTFGHPSDTTLQNLEKRGVKIYRTDISGQISIVVNKNSKLKVKTKINEDN